MFRKLIAPAAALALLAMPTAAAAAWYVVKSESAPQVSGMSACRVADAVLAGEVRVAGPYDSQGEAEQAAGGEPQCKAPNFRN